MKLAAFLFLLPLWISGCSPGMFFGGKNTEVVQTTQYRKINSACSKMELTSPVLDAPTARSILHCFNSYGALEPIEKMIGGLSDRELQPIVEAVNQYLLG